MPNPGLTDKLSGYIVPFHAPEGYAPSFTVAVDIATEGLLTPGYTGSVDLCIDHHPTNTHYAAGTLLCDDRSSCGEIVLEVIKALRGSITKREATLLYMALSTDNGCFKYSNTNAASFRAAAELMRLGADNAGINMRFFRKASPARIKLEGLIYLSMSYYRDGKIAVAEITQDMMRPLARRRRTWTISPVSPAGPRGASSASPSASRPTARAASPCARPRRSTAATSARFSAAAVTPSPRAAPYRHARQGA